MTPFTQPRPQRSITIATSTKLLENGKVLIRRTQSVLNMSAKRLAEIDQFMDKNRGFREED
jgi:hypothetical protein